MKNIVAFIWVLIFPVINIFSQQTEIITMKAVSDFSLTLREGKAPNRLPYNPFHIEKEWNALAGDDLNFAFHMASAEGTFSGKPGTYTVTLNTLTERDGECAYNVYVNDKAVGFCQKNPPTNEFCAPAMLQWTSVEIPANARIRVESNSYSNLRRPEMNFFEYARGRWTAVVFEPEKKPITTTPNILNPASFRNCINIGSSQIKPEMKYHEPAQTYFLVAGGSGLKNKQDSFGYLQKSVSGDFIFETGVTVIGLTNTGSGCAGIMLRQSSSPGSAFIACLVQNDGAIKLQYRQSEGELTKEIIFKLSDAEMIQIERKQGSFIVSAARFGETYERNTVEIPVLKGSSLIGFFVLSGSDKEKEAAAFSNVRLFEN
jgi:hypothetical protein